MIFRQLFDPASSTYTYLLACGRSREGVIVDPVREQADRDLALIGELGVRPVWILETHVHADHVTGARRLKKLTGVNTAVSQHCGATGFDRLLDDRDTVVFGDEVVRAIATPGHTPGSTCFLWRDRLLTGDTLLIGGCGRTDFQMGNALQLYESITRRLFCLPEDTLVYPGHDYGATPTSTVGWERTSNPYLRCASEAEFVALRTGKSPPRPTRGAR